jgi:radical SAM superfamily enzyme YgiQ (UPF0313 family)
MQRLFQKHPSENRVVLITPSSSMSTFYTSSNSDTRVLDIPTLPTLSLGPAYLAAALEESGFEVIVADLSFDIEEKNRVNRIKKEVLDLEPAVIGISAFTSTITSSYKIADSIKKEKEVPIVIGGPHASALPHRTLKECTALDAAIIGEGEHVFNHFIRKLLDENTNGQHDTDLRGVVSRSGSKLIGDSRPAYVEDLDLLPFPARHLFNLKKYAESSRYFDARQFPVTSIVTSRGCPHRCLYCSRVSSGHRFRARSPENVVRELEQLAQYGFREVQIVDDDFTEDRQRVIDICELIQAKDLNMTFNLLGGIRVDRVDEVLLKTMYDSGFYVIHYGAESGDDRVLKYNRKGITVKQIKNAVHIAKNIGFRVVLYVIIGLPGSSIESEKKTINLVNECDHDVTRVSICTPYPGSALWEMYQDQLQDVSWERYNESDVSDPIYLFGDQTKAQLQMWMDMVNVELH